MSIKQRDGDKDANWFYRFNRKGESYCEGGFPTKTLATDAQRIKINSLIDEELHPKEKSKGTELTVRQACQWWLDNHAPQKRSKKNDICRMPLIMDYFGDRLLREITSTDIGKFLAKLGELRGSQVGDHTRNHYRALLHALYERLIETEEYSGRNVVKAVARIEVPAARTRFIYPAEEKILTPAMAAEPDIFAYYYLGVETGMRIGEMMAIRVEHVDMVLRHLFVPDPKNRRSRYVPLEDHMIPFFEQRMAGKSPNDRLMPTWGYTYLNDRFEIICGAASIKLKKGESWHVLRHTFAFNRLSQGESIYEVSRRMGHSSVDVTQRHYGHMEIRDFKKDGRIIKPFLSVIPGCNQIATDGAGIAQAKVLI